MAPLKKAIEALDPAPDKKNQLTLALNLLSELSEQKVAQFTEKIESDLRTAGTTENRTVPVTEILANHSEYRAYVKSDAGKIATEVMGAMKNFLAGGSDAILDGIGKLVTTGLEAIIGAGSGSQQEMKSYYIVVQKFGMVRFDIRAWSRQIEANGITSQIETCMAIVAYKSSVDVKKLSFNSFLVLYQDQLAKIGIPEADWDKYLTEAEAMYKKLGGNTGNGQVLEMESAVYRMAPGHLYGTLWEDPSKDVPRPVLSNLLEN